MNTQVISPAVWHIDNVQDVKNFLHHVIFDLDLGMGFHPDNTFQDYVEFKTGKPTFTKRESGRLNCGLSSCFKYCEKNDLDIYGIGLEIMQPLIDKFTK